MTYGDFMKKFAKTFLALVLAAEALFAVCPLSFGASNFTTKSQFTGQTYTHYGTYANTKVKDMIDVSEHNGLINWYKIKALGIDDAIIRVGYRGYGQAGNMREDNYYYDNVEGALEAGVNIGLYFYSQALNTKEAVAEANFVLKRVKNYKISLPIFFDYEFAEDYNGRLVGRFYDAWNNGTLNKKKLTANVIAFCDTIKKAGYKAGIYSSSGFYTYQYNADNFLNRGYEFWNANYTRNSTSGSFWPNKNHVYKYWQYGGDNVQGCCGEPTSAWVKISYGSQSGYISAQYLDFTSAKAAKVLGDAGLYSGKGSGDIKIIPAKASVSVLSYPKETNTDLNFYYSAQNEKPDFSLSATGSSVTVKWKKMSGMSYYRVYAYDNSTGKYEQLTQTTSVSYTVSGLKKATKYTFLVRGFNNKGTGTPYTKQDNETIMTATEMPTLSFAGSTGKTLSLKWNKVSGASYYRLYSYAPATDKYERLAQTTGTTYTLSGLKVNTKYPVLIRAFNAYDVGCDYKAADVKTFVTSPAAPKFTLKSFSYSVKVKWSAVSGADYYRVYSYDEKTGTYTRLAQVTGTAWEHGPIRANKSYTYLVRAFRKNGYGSDFSAKSRLSIRTLLAKPQFKLSLTDAKHINVKWAKISGASYYRVYTYDVKTGKYQRVAQTTKLSYTYTAALGREYVFLVRAFKANGEGSSYSAANHKSVVTPINKAVFSLKSTQTGTVDITWKTVPSAAYYRVYAYDAESGTYVSICKTTALSYSISDLVSGEEYTYLVRAFSASGIAAKYDSKSDNQSIIVL